MTFVAGTVLTAAALNSELAAKTDTAMVQNAQTGTSYSFALADASKLLTMSNAASNTVTVTKQATVAWVTSTQLRVMNLGAGVTTLVADTGVTINNNKALAQYQGGTLIRTASDVWTFQPNATGKLLQCLSVTKTDTFSTTSTSFVDATGLSVSITPSSTTSKIMVIATINVGGANDTRAYAQMMRGTTAIGIGDQIGTNRRRVSAEWYSIATYGPSWTGNLAMSVLDSPASSAALTYKIQLAASGPTAYINRNDNWSDSSAFATDASTLTVMEVSA